MRVGNRAYIRISGNPFAQPRPVSRIVHRKGCTFYRSSKGRRICDGLAIKGRGKKRCVIVPFDPKTAKAWKKHAKAEIEHQFTGQPLEGPIRLIILAVWGLPKSSERKTTPPPRRFRNMYRDDYDNVEKALGDVGNTVVWKDDSQIIDAHITCIVGRQGEPARTEMIVWEIKDEIVQQVPESLDGLWAHVLASDGDPDSVTSNHATVSLPEVTNS